MLDLEKVTSFRLTAVEFNSRIYSDVWMNHLEILSKKSEPVQNL